MTQRGGSCSPRWQSCTSVGTRPFGVVSVSLMMKWAKEARTGRDGVREIYKDNVLESHDKDCEGGRCATKSSHSRYHVHV